MWWPSQITQVKATFPKQPWGYPPAAGQNFAFFFFCLSGFLCFPFFALTKDSFDFTALTL
jgi:hypothetical protein